MCQGGTIASKDTTHANTNKTTPNRSTLSFNPPNSNLRERMRTEEDEISHSHVTVNPSKNKQQQQQKATLYASLSLAFLITSFSLTLPYLQTRRDELQCDVFCQGSLTSLRSVLSLIGSAMMGRVSDTLALQSQREKNHFRKSSFPALGRILCLYIGNFASLIGLLLSITISSRNGLWYSMIPGALFQQNFSILKAMMSEYHSTKDETTVSDKDETNENTNTNTNPTSATTTERAESTTADRAASIGQLGMSAGLAFMVGPILGATLVSNFSNAVQLGIVMILISTFFLTRMPSITPVVGNDSTQPSSRISGTDQDTHKTPMDLWKRIQTMSSLSSSTIYLMAIRICMSLAFHIFQLIWTVSLKRRFQFGPSDHGKFMSFVGLTYALSQGFVAKRILALATLPSTAKTVVNTTNSELKNPTMNKTHDNRRIHIRILQTCCLVLGFGRYFAFHTHQLSIVYILFGLLVTALGVMNTILTTDTSTIVPMSQLGSIYGLLEAVESSAGIIGPFLGGLFPSPLYFVVALYVLVFLLVTFGYQRYMLKECAKNTSTVVEKKGN